MYYSAMTSTRKNNSVGHEDLKLDLTDLAIGGLHGPPRDTLLRHIASCADCAAELDHLEQLVDSLLLMGSEIDPPVGFEDRLLERVYASGLVSNRGSSAVAEPRWGPSFGADQGRGGRICH
jgi:hypothetical protein